VSIQVEALADEVFAAAAAHARAGAHARRRPFGEVVSMPGYSDLGMVNLIRDLVAPDWTPDDLARVMNAELPGAHRVEITSRDARTIAALGPQLVAAGYQSDTGIAMLQVIPVEPPQARITVSMVEGVAGWAGFDALNRTEAEERDWSQATAGQLLQLCRWRARHTRHTYYVASMGDRPVAYVGLFQQAITAYLHSLFTAPAERRQGIGSAITLAVSARAHEMGSERIALECAPPLAAYYAKLGFRGVGAEERWRRG
jgi:GNAT superfamily N-acetyltransferase